MRRFAYTNDPLVRLRNRVSVRRLKALAEGAEPIPEGYLPARTSGAMGHVTGSTAPPAG